MIRQKKNQESLLDLQWVRRALLLALFDIAIIIASSLLALLARFDFSYAQIEVSYLSNLCHYLPISVIVTLIIFYFCRMYHSLWKFVGVHEFGYMLIANAISFSYRLQVCICCSIRCREVIFSSRLFYRR